MFEKNLFRVGMSQLGHEDLARTHRKEFKRRHSRWTPTWSASDAKIRLVVYEYLAAYIKMNRMDFPPGASLRDLDKLCRDGQKKQCRGSNHNWSEHIRTTQNGLASRATLVIYKAYREGLRATDIAEVLEMTPNAVRQFLMRLNRIARRLFPAEDNFAPIHNARKEPKPRNPHYRPPFKFGETEPTQELLAIAARFNAGESCISLAKEFKVNKDTMLTSMKRFGLQTRIATRLAAPPDGTLKALAERCKAGEPCSKLCKEIGRSGDTLYSMFRTRRLIPVGMGRKRTQFKPKDRLLSGDELSAIAERWIAGEELQDLSKELGMKRYTLHARLWRAGYRRGYKNRYRRFACQTS